MNRRTPKRGSVYAARSVRGQPRQEPAMRKFSRPAAAISAATLGLALLILTPSAAQAAGTVHGCGYGFVCVYPQDKGWNGDHPSYAWQTYGAHNLSNQIRISLRPEQPVRRGLRLRVQRLQRHRQPGLPRHRSRAGVQRLPHAGQLHRAHLRATILTLLVRTVPPTLFSTPRPRVRSAAAGGRALRQCVTTTTEAVWER